MKKLATKTIIRWAGSKRKLIPFLLENTPTTYKRYVEPFCGSACLFFEINPTSALLSDINSDLINALKKLKNTKTIREHLMSLPNNDETYYEMRAKDPKNLNSYERAVRFLYLNRYCFNGVYRTNSAGQFNVPRGNRTGEFPSEDTFKETRKILKSATLDTLDYKDCISLVEKDDFVYLDPPYAKSQRFTGEYGVGSFNSIQIPDLIERLQHMDRIGAKFLFSYRDGEDIRAATPDNFHIKEISVKRHVSGFKTSWTSAKEIIIKNYE